MSKEEIVWYNLNKLNWSWRCVRWLLENYATLIEGQRPHEDKDCAVENPKLQFIGDSGYTDFVGIVITKGKRKRWGYFELSCDVAAELDERMARLGVLGSIMRDRYISGWSQEKVGIWWHIPQRKLSDWDRIGRYFMSGIERRPIDKESLKSLHDQLDILAKKW